MSETPDGETPQIVMAHGGGGELTRRLLAEHVFPKLANDLLDPLTDSATLPRPGGRICLTTDAFVVTPLEFPGGDIGRLAVCGTVNDLAVMGARPLALSLALIVEEGLPIETLDRIIASIAAAAAEAGVPIATGDTKVIDRHDGAGMTITTAGVGELSDETDLSAGRIAAGDVLILNGGLAEHGLAVMSARKGLSFDTDLRSDAAPLNGLVEAMLDAGDAGIRFFRDPTRGGLAGLLADLADETRLGIEIDQDAIPLTPAARNTADMLGLDPLTVANEGKLVAAVSPAAAPAVLAACKQHPLGHAAAVIGRFTPATHLPLVELITRPGGRRIISRPYGEDLPRIC